MASDMNRILKNVLIFLLFLFPPMAFCAALNSPDHDPVSLVIFWVTLIFSFALLGRYIAKRFHQPGVLGELLAGVLIGNLFYFLGSTNGASFFGGSGSGKASGIANSIASSIV